MRSIFQGIRKKDLIKELEKVKDSDCITSIGTYNNRYGVGIVIEINEKIDINIPYQYDIEIECDGGSE